MYFLKKTWGIKEEKEMLLFISLKNVKIFVQVFEVFA